MARAKAKALPPGFRFHPTDVELVLYYLKRKVLGKPLLMDCIAELDMYKFSPWDLPDKSCLQSKDLEWYFFCPKDRKYANGVRINRATETGYWKATGRDRPISNVAETVGMKKTLVFHLGKTHRGERTNWVMHEYRLEIKNWNEAGVSQDSYVLCKLFEKSGVGPKNGEQHGAPFREEEWDNDLEEDSLVLLPHHVESGFPSIIPDDGKNAVSEDITLDIENSCQSSLLPDKNLSSDPRDEILSLLEEVDMESLLAILGRENDLCPTVNDSNEMPELLNCERNIEAPPLLDANDIYGGLDDLSTRSKPKGIDNLGHTNIDDSGIDGMDYIELNDIDDLMKYPAKGDGPNKYPWEVNPENVPSGDQFKCNYETGLESLSIPYISSGTLHPASVVGSSGCMDLESYGMLPYNLDPASDATALGFGIGSSGSMLPNYSGVSDHTHIEDSGVLRQTCLGDGIDYMELSDFDCLMKYPMEGDGPEKYPMGTESCNFLDWARI